MGDEIETAAAPTEMASNAIDAETQSVRAWGLDDGEDEGDVGDRRRLTSRRITAAAVVASLAAVAVACVVGFHYLRTESTSTATTPQALVPTASPATSPPPSPWHLDGTYRVDIRNPEGMVRSGYDGSVTTMSDLGVSTATVWMAYKTECTSTECTALSVSLDDVTHQNTDGGQVLFRWNGTEWESTGGEGPNGGHTHSVKCTGGPGSDTLETWGTMSPLPDGSFRGTFHRTTVTAVCIGSLPGDQQDVPMAAVRIGDAPPGVFP